MSKIGVRLEEVKEVFLLLEKLQDFMHRPMNCENQENLISYIEAIYPKVRRLYYDIVWH